jgi:tetrapyrrole methylase family protein/MazG family protein
VPAAPQPHITVAGLGPGALDLVTANTHAACARAEHVYLRTRRHPSAALAPDAPSFDAHYEHAGTFEEVYQRIVADLVAAAREHGEVLYLVPGSPFVLERSVDILRGDLAADVAGDVEVEVLPAMSFIDLVWCRVGVDPFADGVRIVDAHRFAERAAGDRGPLLVGHCHNQRVLSDVKLAFEDDPPARATVLQRLGLLDEAVFDVSWDDLDRAFEADHLTSLWIPQAAAPVGAELVRFAEVVRALRRDCPWDREQTHESLRPYLLEESYEVLEAIDHRHDDAGDDAFEEELGDLLFQVYLHAALAEERGAFTLADVARGIADKLVARHPHVFAGADPDESISRWDEMKRVEKGRTSAMDGIPEALPALALAAKVLRRCGSAGVDWTTLVADDDPARPLLALVAAFGVEGNDAEDELRRAAAQLRAAARDAGA